ncbi:MAG TPA: glucosamine-6-phosphate deaminase [Kiritimatiellia bacterium]|nr:glucosamine-6-phosphate deaminase [Kiritimatiellia bacterium]
MKWTQVPDYEAMSRMAAQRLFDVISGKLAKRQQVRVGLATGNTMIRVYGMLAGLLNKAGHELSDLSTYNLDEYVDGQGGNVAPSHPLSYRKYMTEYFYDLVDTRLGFKQANMFFPDAGNPAAYDTQIAEAGGLDFQLLGIGFNGHIAFNEPQPESEITAEAFAALPSRVISLASQTVLANACLTAAGDLSAVPRQAVTMGMRQILAARDILLVACFTEQTAPLRLLKAGRVSTETPASFLLNHPSVEVIYTTDTITV